MRQHLTAVRAAAEIGGAIVEGDAPRSGELSFEPGEVRPGSYRFSVGTAGSTTLVLQAVLPALLCAPGPSDLTIEGGTHNPMAPPFDYLERAYLPLVERMGPRVRVELERPGFYPAGGGLLKVSVTPSSKLSPLTLDERGVFRRIFAVARVAGFLAKIGHRELRQIRNLLELDREDLICEELDPKVGPGNVVFVEARTESLTEVFTAFGQKGVPAERVGKQVAREAKRWLDAGVPVGEHLADQLILLLSLAGGGSFRTLPLSSHATTQIDLVRRFLEVSIEVEEEAVDRCRVVISG
jgi:RNA 3'-terminal phosphate cyclase (ATP)